MADCYDTMTTVSTYKSSMSPKAARAELAACAGTHFDPRIVRAFLDVSIGRVRPVAGPLAWLGSLPFVSSIPQAVSVLGRVGAASVAVTGAVTAGTFRVGTRPLLPPVAQASPTTTTTGPGSTGSGPGDASGHHPAQAPGSVAPAAGTVPTTVAGGAGGLAGGGPSGGGGSGGEPDGPPPATAPGAPTAVVGVVGPGQVTVSWSAPDDGGSPITSYVVTPSAAGAAQAGRTFASPATTRVVTGLTDGTSYSFSVVAVNAVGSGPPSTSSAAVTPLAPSLTVSGGAKARQGPGGESDHRDVLPGAPGLRCAAHGVRRRPPTSSAPAWS